MQYKGPVYKTSAIRTLITTFCTSLYLLNPHPLCCFCWYVFVLAGSNIFCSMLTHNCKSQLFSYLSSQVLSSTPPMPTTLLLGCLSVGMEWFACVSIAEQHRRTNLMT